MAIGTPVQIGTDVDSSSGPYSITTTGAVPAGSRIVLVIQWCQFTSVGTVTVSGGGLSWTEDLLATGTHQTNGGGKAVWSADCPSGLASSTALTPALTVGGGGNRWGMGVLAFHVSGLAASGRGDGINYKNQAAGTAWDATALVTTNADDLLLLMALGDGVTSAATAVDSPWIELGDFYDVGNDWCHSVSYRIESTAGSKAGGGDWAVSAGFTSDISIGALEAELPWPPAGADNSTATLRPYLTARLR